MKKPRFLLNNNFKLKRPIGPGLSVFRRFLFLGALLISASGCTAEGLQLLAQLEATDLKQAIVADRTWCKQNVGDNSKYRNDLCNDFFPSLRITSHCVTMRKTEPVEQEYCERFFYRKLIRPTRIFGQDDETYDDLAGKGDAAGPDWFDFSILDDFLHIIPTERDHKPATADERKLILKRIAEDVKKADDDDAFAFPNQLLSQGIREQDMLTFNFRIRDANKDKRLSGAWRPPGGSANRMFRFMRLFDDTTTSDYQLGLSFTGAVPQNNKRRDLLNMDLEPDTADTKETFLKIALSQTPVNIRAVQWVDDYLFAMTRTEPSASRRQIYLKHWCSSEWDADTDQKMMDLHEIPEAWHEDNQFFVRLLYQALRNDWQSDFPTSVSSWWEDWPENNNAGDTAWEALPGDSDAEKIKRLLDDGEWREKICDPAGPFEPFAA